MEPKSDSGNASVKEHQFLGNGLSHSRLEASGNRQRNAVPATKLTSIAARRILTVPDTSSHVPGDIAIPQPDAGQPSISLPPPDNSGSPIPTPEVAAPASVAAAPEIAAALSASPADWTATSITITLSE
jgi:hypothetical protein